MTAFPKQAIVNLPAGTLLEGDCLVSVRVTPHDDIPHLKRLYGKRLLNFEIGEGRHHDVGLCRSLEGTRLRIVTCGREPLQAGGVVEALKRTTPIFVIVPDENTLRNANTLTSLGFRVHIDAAAPVDSEDALLRALDFYLHNPLLSTPVEPFHTLLRTASASRGHDLWDIQSENVKINFYVSDNGEVALAKRWTSSGLNYGTLDNTWDEIVNGALMRRLLSFKADLFRQQNQCVFCRHLDLCGGFLRAVEPEWQCNIWQELFKTLRDEARKAKDLLDSVP